MSSEEYIYLKPVQGDNGRYSLLNPNGDDVYKDLDVHHGLMNKAVSNEQAIRYNTKTDRARRVDMDMYFERTRSVPMNEQKQAEEPDVEHEDITNFIQHEAVALKPDELFMDDITWKYLIRNVVRAQNTMMVGPTGSGKTQTIKWVAQALGRDLFTFNLGATQDPRGALIGNTHFDNDKGTFFNQSPFVEAIQTPNAVILLDELSRANPEAFNILMTVLDEGQRFLRLDEAQDSPVIDIHPTVTFMATANIGHEYSSTRVIDRALKDRFVPIRMEYLNESDEYQLLTKLFPDVSNHNRSMVAKAVTEVREDVASEDGQLEHNLSTRHSIEMTSLLNDGFSVSEVLKLVVWPQYDTDGGTDSDQTYVKQLIQAVITEEPEDIEESMGVSDDDEIPEF